jgi:uncharacterized protein (DUF433 family)
MKAALSEPEVITGKGKSVSVTTRWLPEAGRQRERLAHPRGRLPGGLQSSASCYVARMNAANLITIDPDILGGTPVFKGTRVPVKTLFDYLADNLTLNYFLESFPSVSRELAVSVLRCSQEDIEHQAAA